MLYYRSITLLFLIASFWAHRWLPPEWGWENSLLEWAQVVLLVIGLVLSWIVFSTFNAKNKQIHYFGLFTTPCWLMLIGRELSWGRVFYPIGIEAAKGPYFPALKELWFGPFVYPFNTAIMLLWLFAIIKYKLYMIPVKMIRERLFPSINFLLILVGAIIAHIAEHHINLPITEEISETVVYIGLIIVTLQIKHNLLINDYLADTIITPGTKNKFV